MCLTLELWINTENHSKLVIFGNLLQGANPVDALKKYFRIGKRVPRSLTTFHYCHFRNLGVRTTWVGQNFISPQSNIFMCLDHSLLRKGYIAITVSLRRWLIDWLVNRWFVKFVNRD